MLLALLSFCMVGTWVYHLHDKLEYSRHPKVIYVTEKGPAKNQDSITSANTGSSIIDTIDLSGDTSIQAMIKLRNEIAQILSDSHITRTDLTLAEQKINILQKKIAILSGTEKSTKTDSANIRPPDNKEADNNKEPKPAPSVAGAQKDNPAEELGTAKTYTEKTAKYNLASTFGASMISLRAISGNDPNEATMVADETDHLSISFCVKSENISFRSTSVFVVLVDPDGNIVEDDAWEAGMLNTMTEGSVRYTRKFIIEYNRGDTKKIDLSIRLPKFYPGTYRLRIYHNGQRIGKAVLPLS